MRVQRVKFLGHIVDNQGIHADPSKVQAIIDMRPPSNTQELRRFLGMANYLMKFVPNMSEIAHPMNALLNAKSEWVWTSAQQKSFELLKKKLSESPVLSVFDPENMTVVSADASSFGLGAVLRQKQKDGVYRPVAYASRSLSETERRYAQIEKEGLAVTWACEKFQEYVTGLQFTIETDHKPLVPIFMSKHLSDITPRLQRL